MEDRNQEIPDGRKPLEVVGWLGTSGYQTIIHQATREAELETKKNKPGGTTHVPRP